MAKPPPSVQGGPSFFDETEGPAVAKSDRRLIVEADGGSRGNPGPAAYGLDPTAALEVRMDSRLVIEQMAGRWKVKHADMKSLALEAARLRPAAVTWTWVPRELNKVADTLVNRALDGDPVPRENPLARPRAV